MLAMRRPQSVNLPGVTTRGYRRDDLAEEAQDDARLDVDRLDHLRRLDDARQV